MPDNPTALGIRKTALNRADLIWCLVRFDGASLDDMAQFIGYRRRVQKRQTKLREISQVTGQPGQKPQLGDAGETTSESKVKPQARFHHVVEHHTIERDTTRTEVPQWLLLAEPFRDEIRADSSKHPPTMPSLAPWSRLWPFLRAALGVRREGKELDFKQTVASIALGKSLRRLPYRQRQSWTPVCQVIVDFSARLLPSWSEFNELCVAFERLRGRAGLEILVLEQGPDGPCRSWRHSDRGAQPYSMPEAGTPILVLSDLGCLENDTDERNTWLRFGKRLRTAGLVPIALMPCPKRRWESALARLFIPVCWDRGVRLSHVLHGKRTLPAGQFQESDAGAERLLALLSPAIRIEPALLRDVRYLLPPEAADVGE